MIDKLFYTVGWMVLFGIVTVLLYILPGGILLPAFIFTNLSHLEYIIHTIAYFFYYFAIGLFYLGMSGLIVHNSFKHVEQIIQLKMSNHLKIYDSEKYSNNTKQIFKHIILNLTFLSCSIYLNLYFNNIVVKVPLILYICWTLGFTASFPLNKELISKLTSDQVKDYLLLKSIINTVIFLLIYFLIGYVYTLIY